MDNRTLHLKKQKKKMKKKKKKKNILCLLVNRAIKIITKEVAVLLV